MRNVRYFSFSDVESLSDLGEKYEYGPFAGRYGKWTEA